MLLVFKICPKTYIKQINRLIFNFVWNTTDRIKRNILIGKKIMGNKYN